MGGLIQFVIFLMSKSYNYAMRVLMISGDPGVLDPKSETGKRTEEYRQVFGTLDVLLCYGNIFRFIGPLKQSAETLIFPIEIPSITVYNIR